MIEQIEGVNISRRITAVSVDELYVEHQVARQEVDPYESHLVAEQER